MSTRLKGFIILVIAFVSLGSAFYIQNRLMQNVRKYAPFLDTWSFSGRSGEALKIMSLGYDMVAADFMWLRAIQTFGGRGMTNRDWRPVYDQFEALVTIDPYFEDAYSFANLVISDEAGQRKAGLDILTTGTFKLTREYRLPFEAMYVGKWADANTTQARWFGRIATKRMNAPDWVERVAAYVEVASGQFYVGLDRFIGNFLRGAGSKDEIMVRIALGKIADTIDDWNKNIMREAYDAYVKRTGTVPTSLQQIANEASLQNYEIGEMDRFLASYFRVSQKIGSDPLETLKPEFLETFARPSQETLASQVENADELAKVEKLLDAQNIIFRAALTKRSGLPKSPRNTEYVLNLTEAGNPFGDPKKLIMNRNEAIEECRRLLTMVRDVITRFKTANGRNPASLREAFHTDFATTEPLGGQFLYNPQTGEFKSTSVPD